MEQAPVPRAFTLVPIDFSKFDPRRTVPHFVSGQKLKFTLYSEHSLIPVLTKEITLSAKWVKWIGPVAKITAFALTGLAVPMTGEAAELLADETNFMSSLGGVAPTGALDFPEDLENEADKDEDTRVCWASRPLQAQLVKFYEDIGIAPGFGGLEFAKFPGKGYLWATKNEKEAHAEELPMLVFQPNEKSGDDGTTL